MKKSKKIIHTQVKENTDEFDWNDLNCFYRVFAIALKSNNEKFFEAFVLYISAYILYAIKGTGYLSYDCDDCILEYYNKEVSMIFDSQISVQGYGSHNSFKKSVFNALNDNKVVVIPCDLFYLPYSKSYLEIHKRHYLIVKGMDYDKDIFYILDNMHNELGASPKYTDFMIKTDDVYNMSKSFGKVFTHRNDFFWTVELKDSVNLNVSDNFVALNQKYLSKVICNMGKKENYLELDILNGNSNIDMKNYLSYANLRKTYLTILVNYLKDEQEISKVNSLIEDWKNIKLLMAASIQRGCRDVSALEKKIESCIEKEYSVYLAVEKELSTGTNLVVDDCYKYSESNIINENNAFVSLNNNVVNIVLSSNDTYDIWNNINKGVVVFFDEVLPNKEFIVNMKMDTEFGSSCNAGIYIEFETGDRVLFGSMGRLNMAIHMLDGSADYEKIIYPEVFEEKSSLKIDWSDKECRFYSGDMEHSRYELKLIDKIKRVGVFAKTWEHCNCDVEFMLDS